MAKRICSINLGEYEARIAIFRRRGKSYQLEELITRRIEELPIYLKSNPYPVYASFYPKGVQFGEETLPITKSRFLELNLRKKITETGMFEDAFLLRHRVLEKRDPFQRVNYSALTLAERGRVTTHLALDIYKLEALYPIQVSLVSFLSSFVRQLSCALYPINEGYEVVFFEGLSVFYSRRITTVEADKEEYLLQTLEETFSYFKQLYKKVPESLYLFSGEHVDVLEKRLGLKVIRPKLSHILSGEFPEEHLSVLSVLVGNLLAPKDFNFLEVGYLSELYAGRWTKRASVLVLFISVLLLLLSGSLLLQTIKEKKKYHDLYMKTRQDVASIMQVQPSDEELEKMQGFIELYRAFQAQPKLDRFLVWLSSHYPPRSIITSMVAEPVIPEVKNQPPESPRAIPRGFDTLKISLTGEMAGTYEEVKKGFYLFISELERNWEVVKSDLNYEGSTGTFNLVINYKKRKV